MSVAADVYVHPRTHARVRSWEGFSWPCLFAGPFWFLHKRMPMWFVVSLLASVATLGFAWLVLPFVANALHRLHLAEAGWFVLTATLVDRAGQPSALACPACGQPIARDAERCVHCGTSILPWPWAS